MPWQNIKWYEIIEIKEIFSPHLTIVCDLIQKRYDECNKNVTCFDKKHMYVMLCSNICKRGTRTKQGEYNVEKRIQV